MDTMSELPLVLSGPEQVLAALPYLIPGPVQNHLVLVWLDNGSVRRCLSAPRDELVPGWAGAALQSGAGQGLECVAVVDGADRAEAAGIAHELLAAAEGLDVPVLDILWSARGRWGSARCTDPSCCPVEGRVLDRAVMERVRAELVYRGVRRRADVEDGTRAERGARSRVRNLVDGYTEKSDGPEDAKDLLAPCLDHLSSAGSEEGSARLAVGLRSIKVRDQVLWHVARMNESDLALAGESLSYASRCVPADLVSAVGTCEAIVHWLHGDPERMRAALDRALQADPSYSLALLLESALTTGMGAQEWREAIRSLDWDRVA